MHIIRTWAFQRCLSFGKAMREASKTGKQQVESSRLFLCQIPSLEFCKFDINAMI